MGPHATEHARRASLLVLAILLACRSRPSPASSSEPPSPAAASTSSPAAAAPLPAHALVAPLDGDPIEDFAFSRSGRWLAVATGEPIVRLYETRAGHLVATLRPPSLDGSRRLAWSPDEHHLALSGSGPRIALWDLSRDAPEAELLVDRGSVDALAWSPDGATLVASGTWEVLRWDVQTRIPRPSLATPGRAQELAFSPDGGELAVADDSGALTVFGDDGIARFALAGVRPCPCGYTALAWSPDGATIAAGWGARMDLVDAAAGARRLALQSEGMTTHDLAFDPSGRWFVQGDENGDLAIYESASGQRADGPFRAGRSGPPRASVTRSRVAWNADGTVIAAADDTGLTLVSATQGTVIARPIALRAPPPGELPERGQVRFSRDGSTILEWREGARVWDARTGRLRARSSADVSTAASSPDGARVALGVRRLDEQEFDVVLLDVATGRTTATWRAPYEIACLESTPDGAAFLASTAPATDPWRSEAEKERATRHFALDAATLAPRPGSATARCKEEGASSSRAVSPDGQLVAVPGAYGLRLLRVADGAALGLRASPDIEGKPASIALTDAGCVDGDDAALAPIEARLGDGLTESKLAPLPGLGGAARCPGLFAAFREGRPLPDPPPFSVGH